MITGTSHNYPSISLVGGNTYHIWSSFEDHHYSFVGTTSTPNTMSTTTYDILETVSYNTLQHATIAGYDLAYNKKQIRQKTTVKPDGTQEVKQFTVLTLVHKSRNGARAYLDHFTDGEGFTMMLKITGSYSASAKGMKNCYALIKQYLANPTDETVTA